MRGFPCSRSSFHHRAAWRVTIALRQVGSLQGCTLHRMLSMAFIAAQRPEGNPYTLFSFLFPRPYAKIHPRHVPRLLAASMYTAFVCMAAHRRASDYSPRRFRLLPAHIPADITCTAYRAAKQALRLTRPMTKGRAFTAHSTNIRTEVYRFQKLFFGSGSRVSRNSSGTTPLFTASMSAVVRVRSIRSQPVSK